VNEREWYAQLSGEHKADKEVLRRMFTPRKVPQFVAEAGIGARTAAGGASGSGSSDGAAADAGRAIKRLMRPRMSRVEYLERRGIFGLGNDGSGAETTRATGRIYGAPGAGWPSLFGDGASMLETDARKQRVSENLAGRRPSDGAGAGGYEVTNWYKHDNPFHRTLFKWRERIQNDYIFAA